MDELFQQFLREKRFLHNVSENTIDFYKCAYIAYKKRGAGNLTKTGLKEFVIRLKESGLKTGSINCYIRGLNSFLAWLHENEHINEPLKMSLLREERTILKTFSDEQLRALVSYRPNNRPDKRLHTLICLLIDTGIRIEEALTLTRENIDLDNLLIKVRGKGNKERFVPISLECRKVLHRHLNSHSSFIVFCTRDGSRVTYRNCLRDFKNLAKRLGIEGGRGSFHTLRHGFALNYVRQGGSLFHLQKGLGHTTLQMTRRYCELTEDDLKQMHLKTSLLSRLK